MKQFGSGQQSDHRQVVCFTDFRVVRINEILSAIGNMIELPARDIGMVGVIKHGGEVQLDCEIRWIEGVRSKMTQGSEYLLLC